MEQEAKMAEQWPEALLCPPFLCLVSTNCVTADVPGPVNPTQHVATGKIAQEQRCG